MRILAAFSVVLFSAAFAQAQHHEITVGTTFIDAPQSGYEFPFYSNGFSGKVHFSGIEVGTAYGYGNFPKRGTPGGHRTAFGAFANYWFGEHVFVGADWSNIYGDATAWTKEVQFAGVSGGYRFVHAPRVRQKVVLYQNGTFRVEQKRLPGRHEDRFTVSYDKEIKTDAAQPNKSDQWSVLWAHDFPINGHLAIRSNCSFAFGHFDQFVFRADHPQGGSVERLSSTSVAYGVSLLIH